MISKEFKRSYINANPSRWKSFNYRNIHCWRYSIIGKHYRYCRFWVLHQELLFSFWLHNDCEAFSRYTALYRIEILYLTLNLFQGLSLLQVLENTKTPAGILKKKRAAENYPKFAALILDDELGKMVLTFSPVCGSFYVFLKRFTMITSHLKRIDFMMQRNDFSAERLERLSVFSFMMQRNDRNDSQNLPSETTRSQYYAAHIDSWLTTNYLKFPITCVGSFQHFTRYGLSYNLPMICVIMLFWGAGGERFWTFLKEEAVGRNGATLLLTIDKPTRVFQHNSSTRIDNIFTNKNGE